MSKEKLFKNKYVAIIGALICTSLWGTAFPLIKLGYDKFAIEQGDIGSKLLFAGERFLLAGIIVLIIGLFTEKKGMLVSKKSIAPVIALGFVQTFLQYLFSYIGVSYTTATNTSIITGATSLITVILAGIFIKSDKLNSVKILGCIVGFCGIIIVNISGLTVGSISLIGDGIVLLSAISGAGGNIITKFATKSTDPVAATAYQLSFGGICLLIAGIIINGHTDFSKLDGVIILLWLSLVSAVSFLLWTVLLRYHPVSKISSFTMLIPIFGTVWSGIILSEAIFRLESLAALALVSAGIVVINRK